MDKTIFVLLDACQYAAGTRNLGYLEHLIDYKKGAKYKVKGELPSLSRPMYATLLTGLPAYRHGIAANETVRTLHCEHVFSLCKAARRDYGGVLRAVGGQRGLDPLNGPALCRDHRIHDGREHLVREHAPFAV